MSQIIRSEQAINVFGVEARAFAVIGANPDTPGSNPGHILNQTIKATRTFTKSSHKYRITAQLRFDDNCKNGHEDFAITADIDELRGGKWREDSYGCLHDDIAEHFPEWAHLIKWHLTGTNGPMHYLANTVYHTGDRDHWGLHKGERRQIRNGRTGDLAWNLEAVNPGPDWISDTPTGKEYVERETVPLFILKKGANGERPPVAPVLVWAPMYQCGEGKERELDSARRSAVWPDATDAELSVEPEALKKALMARLPALKAAFKADMLAVGFVWPDWLEGESE